jgi:hypothetical protein
MTLNQTKTSNVSAVLVTLSLLASPALAQTVLMTVNLNEFNAVAAYPVDDDGNPATPDAWLLDLTPPDARVAKQFQLVVVTAAGLCSEDVFTVKTALSTITRETLAGRTVLIQVTSSRSTTTMRVLTLDRVRCR